MDMQPGVSDARDILSYGDGVQIDPAGEDPAYSQQRGVQQQHYTQLHIHLRKARYA